jgi:hypothetical protein
MCVSAAFLFSICQSSMAKKNQKIKGQGPPNKKKTIKNGGSDDILRRQLSRIGLVEKIITGDGNCLFRSLSDQIWGDPERHLEMRRVICEHIDLNKGDYEMFT